MDATLPVRRHPVLGNPSRPVNELAHHIADAEALAAPLADPRAFSAGSAWVDNELLRTYVTEKVRDLRRPDLADPTVENHLRWAPRTDKGRVSVLSFLAHFANPRLEIDDERPVWRKAIAWRDGVRAARCMSLALPAATLAALCADKPLTSTTVSYPKPSKQGLEAAHLHVHLGASLPFEALWAWMAAHPSEGRQEWSKDRGAPLNGKDMWAGWLLRALIGRWWLAHTLRLGPKFPTGDPWFERALSELRSGRAIRIDPELDRRLALRMPSARPSGRMPRCLAELYASDPVVVRPDPKSIGLERARWPEGALIWHARRSDDPEVARTLVQMLRVKVLLFRHLVADAGEPGLGPFVCRYNRIKRYAPDEAEVLALEALANEPEMKLVALEARKAPPKTAGKTLALAASSARASAARRPLRYAWVLHFLRGDGALRKQRSDMRSRADALRAALRTWPSLLKVVRALDVAGHEAAGPLWLAAPFIRAVREVSRKVDDTRRLAVTLHCGEDFVHPLTGLRAIDEPFRFGLMDNGDRIGHATALGVDLKDWMHRHPLVRMPAFTRLLDLAWVLLTDREGGIVLDLEHAAVWSLFQATAAKFGETIEEADATSLLDAIERMHVGTGWLDSLDPTLARLARWASSRGPFVDVRFDPLEERLVHLARTWVARRARKHVIEVNPTSNLVIAPLPALLHQHWPEGTRLTINADDPLTFQTTLHDELCLAASVVEWHRVEEWARNSVEATFAREESASVATLGPAPGPAGRAWRLPAAGT
jgi:hypothetical protein